MRITSWAYADTHSFLVLLPPLRGAPFKGVLRHSLRPSRKSIEWRAPLRVFLDELNTSRYYICFSRDIYGLPAAQTIKCYQKNLIDSNECSSSFQNHQTLVSKGSYMIDWPYTKLLHRDFRFDWKWDTKIVAATICKWRQNGKQKSGLLKGDQHHNF